MRRALAAIVLGLAFGAGVLGFAINESSGANSTTPTSGLSTSAIPAAHDDSNTDGDEEVFLNPNVIHGQPTTICTRSPNPRLVQVLSQAIKVWHDRLSPDSDGDGKIDADALFDHHVFQRVTLPACAGAKVEVVENTLLVNGSSISVKCKGGAFDPAIGGSPRACYKHRTTSSPPRKLFKSEQEVDASVLEDRAVLVYQALSHQPSSADHVGTMVHELGHILGLSHYDGADHCDQLRDSTVNPLGDHFTAMSSRPRAGTTACETNGVITGRDLRDLYEAYHIGPLANVRLDGDVRVTSSNQVTATFHWGEDGGEELSHNATHILAQRKTSSGWSTIGAAKVFDKDGKRRMMMTVRDCGGLAAEYRLVGSSAFRMGLSAFVDDASLAAPTASRHSVWTLPCVPNLSAQALVQHPIGDPAHVTGVAVWNEPDNKGWCDSGEACPQILSASINQAYCLTGAVRPPISYLATGGDSGSAMTVVIIGGHVPPPTLKGLPPLPQCDLTAGATSFTVSARWGTQAGDPSRSVTLPVQVIARPKPVKFDIAPSAAPGTCSPGDTVSIGWKLTSDSGAPLTVFAYDESATASPLVVSCPAGVATGSSVEVWVLRHDGGGRQVTASETQPLTLSKVSFVRNCVAGEETTTNFDLSGGSGPYAYTDRLGVSRTKDNPGSTWPFGYRCPSSHGPSELTITVTDGVGRTVSAPVALNVTCGLPLQAPSVPFAQVGGIGSGAISLTWSEVCAESYRVQLSPADLDGRDTVETDRPPVTITRLRPNTIYRFTVQALAQGETSNESVPASMRTAPPAPQAKAEFDAWAGASGGMYSVLVSWAETVGAAGYLGEIIDVSPGSPIDAVVIGTAEDDDCAAPTSERTLRYCGLSANAVYEIAVEARNSGGHASDPGRALACLGPCALEISQVTTSGLKLNWIALEPYESQLLHHVRVRSGDTVLGEDRGSHVTQATLGNLSLEGETTYTVEVRLYSSKRGGFTDWVGTTFTTPKAELALSASVNPVRCEVGQIAGVSWEVTGGTAPYEVTVRVDGDLESPRPVRVDCDVVGSKQIVVEATDATEPEESVSKTLVLTIIPPPLMLSASLDADTCHVGQQARLTWNVSGGTKPYRVVVAGQQDPNSPVKVECDAVGTKQIVVTATDSSTPTAQTQTKTLELTVSALPPLTLSASASPASCETDGEVTLSWTVGGGSGTHTVTVDGVKQSGDSTTVTCQVEPGTQTVTVTATDQAASVASVTQRVQLTVTAAASQTVSAEIRAQRLSDNRVEFRLRLGDGTDLTTAERFMNLPVVVAGRWYSSGAFTTAIDGTDYRLGVVSVRLDNTVCPAQVWVTFLPTEGERITPTKYKLPVDREANLWAVTSKFEVTLVETPSSDAVRQGGAVYSMDAAPEGASPVPGREGGLMLGDEAPADAQRQQSVKTCTDAPTGLATSNLTSSGARLSWGKVAAASEYDIAVGDGASTQLASSKTSYDFSGLAADTSHTLKVRARSWQGASEWSSKVVRTKVSPVPVITIAASASPVDEGGSASFTVTSDRTLITALDVKLSVTESGAMLSGTPATQVTIAKAAKSATVSVATADDEQDEDDSLVTATLLAGTGYQLGAAKTATVTVADDDGQEPQLTLTLTSSSNRCETGGQVTVGWTVTGGSGTYTVTVDGTSQSGASATVTCQSTAGTQTVTVVVTDKTDTTLTKTETLDLSVTVPPLTLAAKASPTSCDTGGQVTVSWTVGGGSGAYSVTVDGAKQSGSSTTVSCQATAGAQTVSVVATDKADNKRTKTQQLTLTVTKPPGTVTATLRARRLTDNRFELGLRLADGTDVSVTKRFANPPLMTSGGWKQSEALSATIAGRSYTLGQISVRLENDRCPSRLELSFLPAAGSRSLPQQRFLRTDAEAESWFSGSEFTITLSSSDSLSAQQSAGNGPTVRNLLDDTPDATNAGPGTEGGALSGETPSPVPDALAQADAQSSGTPVCPSAPSGLATSQITTDRIRLSWQAVTGASQYDLRRGSLNLDPVTTVSYSFTGLSAGTSYSLQVRARDAWGASPWSSVTETALPEVPDKPTNLRATATKDSLTLGWDGAPRATAYRVRIGTGSSTPPNQPPRGHQFTKLSPNTSYTLAVQASNRGGSSAWAQITIKTKPEPVTLTASVSPTSCEPGDPLTVTWTAGGGTGSYRVTVDGSAQAGSSAELTCQQTAGTQTITVKATDAAHTDLSATVSLSVTVTAPPTVTGRMEARRVSSGRVEVAFRPQGGARILPSGRFYTPDVSKLNRWASSTNVYGPAGSETNRLLGQITVKHVLSGGKYYVDVCFRPAGASTRLCPTPNNFYYANATEDRWHNTGTVTFSPRRASDGVRGDGAQSGTAQEDLLKPPAPGEGDAAGTEGGLMSDQG